MIKFCTLFSSSSGNSTFVSNGKSNILVDAGGSCKSVCEKLTQIGEDIFSVKAILLTHEHIDHIKALKVLTKKYNIPIYANEKVLSFLAEKDLVSEKATLNEIDLDKDFVIEDFNIKAFRTSHDSLKSNGFVIETENGKKSKLGVATDLGVFSETVENSLKGCDGVVLESNYDKSMLACGKYPYSLKRRIMSETGHLSNEDCATSAKTLLKNGTRHFVLAHLSRENNLPVLASQTTKTALFEVGAREESDFTLNLAHHDRPSNIITI